MSEREPGSGERKRRGGSRVLEILVKKVLAPVLALALILFILGYTNLITFAGFSRGGGSALRELRLENIGELATQAAYYTGVATIDDNRVIGVGGKKINVPFTNSKVIYSYDGVIKAGMDFSEITYTVDTKEKTLTVRMPEARILSNEIDTNSLRVYDEKHSVYTLIRVERFSDSIGDLKAEAETRAIGKGILSEARTNAEMLIRGFLSAGYDMDEYTVRFE